jgi:hypothetical protein
VHLVLSSLGFLAEAQPRLENRRGDKRHLLADVHIRFFRRPHEHHWKNYKFILYHLIFSNM